MTRLVEFGAAPRTEIVDGKWVTTWHSKMTVDLRWIAGAQPGSLDASCRVLMAGSNQWTEIDCPYPEFMKKWTEFMDPPRYLVEPGPVGGGLSSSSIIYMDVP